VIASQIANLLLDIEAVRLRPEQPFQWSSGWLSPIYCDNRLTLSFPEVRTVIKNALVELVKTKFTNVDAIAGVATAGIPQGVLVADALNLPFVYVRSAPKGHGLENLIEGKIEKNQRIVVVEDLISTGGSSLKVVDALTNAGANPIGIIAIMTYGFDAAKKSFREKNIELHCLTNYTQVIVEAITRNMIDKTVLASLEEWRNAPEVWQNA
jgi:orotate phosphoribosyltransferase